MNLPSWVFYVLLVVGGIIAFELSALVSLLFRAARWRLRTLAEEQEHQFRVLAAGINRYYQEKNITRRIRP